MYRIIRACISLFLVFLVSGVPALAQPAVPERTPAEWQAVARRVKKGTAVSITTRAGEAVSGAFVSAANAGVVIDLPDTPIPGRPGAALVVPERTVPYGEIRRMTAPGVIQEAPAAATPGEWAKTARRIRTGERVELTTRSGEVLLGPCVRADAMAITVGGRDVSAAGGPAPIGKTPERTLPYTEVQALIYEGTLKAPAGERAVTWSLIAAIVAGVGLLAWGLSIRGD